MNRREFLAASAAAWAAGANFRTRADACASGETLYNGIRLPSAWPPRLKQPLDTTLLPPYLQTPPAEIPIDVGRQLFVDDFLIEQTTLTRTFHRPKPHDGNPILRPDRAWEIAGGKPMAMVFSDGVWYDPADRLFKMWYMGGYGRSVCFARSEDGIRWEKPELDVTRGTNIVHPGPRDSATVWLDQHVTDTERRFVLFRGHSDPIDKRFGESVHFSSDGIHWSDRAVRSGSVGDRTTAFYNPFRKVWVYSNRQGWGAPRRRRYWEMPDLVTGPQWNQITEPTMWVGADALDPQREDLKIIPQPYNLDCVAYESLIFELFTIWRGDLNKPPGRPKLNNLCTGFSRDGFHWHRPDREPFINVSEKPGDWNWGNVQSAGGCCLVVGDELYFYHSGRAGFPGSDGKNRDCNGSTGLAILRRDGFASMDAGDSAGMLTTRPVRFTGKYLFVNAAVSAGGELSAEILDERGQSLPSLSAAECIAMRADKTRQRLTWKNADLSAVTGRLVRFRFHMRNAHFYAFWVSRNESGASDGYVAAGGPGLTDRDA